MRSVIKAVSITAGGIAMASALSLGLAYGLLVGVVSAGVGLDTQHDEELM